MRTEAAAGPARSRLIPPPESLQGAIEPDTHRRESSASLPCAAPHDATVLLAALEQLQVQREAMERLLDADLLHLILV